MIFPKAVFLTGRVVMSCVPRVNICDLACGHTFQCVGGTWVGGTTDAAGPLPREGCGLEGEFLNEKGSAINRWQRNAR